MVEASFITVLVVAGIGLALSILIERLMVPRPTLARPWAAWVLHGGLWLVFYALMTLILGRPWFSAAIVLAIILMVVLVNNAKFNSLREPFVFQDYEYFTDAMRYPRLYIPFLGWWKFLGAATGFILAISIGLWGESVPDQRFILSGQAGGILLLLMLSVSLLLLGNHQRLPITFNPQQDIVKLGLLTSFWRYAQAERKFPKTPTTFEYTTLPERQPNSLPHLVAVQSESFFDPRSLYTGIRPDILTQFDHLRAGALLCGKLKVPAWGANTVRTEFAFLSGINEQTLGVHRFNPYRALAAGWEIASIASFLKKLGYYTICIHPYPASFYRRARVYPRLGFDEFLDIRLFTDTMRFGPYTGDAAVAEQASALLATAKKPLFIFIITMENHGPLHLEQVSPADIEQLYLTPPPVGCDDLTIYLRHLRNADGMVAQLRHTLENCDRAASLCWYGDHVPIMPTVYDIFGAPEGEVDYVCWSNQHKPAIPSDYHNLRIETLANKWLTAIFPELNWRNTNI